MDEYGEKSVYILNVSIYQIHYQRLPEHGFRCLNPTPLQHIASFFYSPGMPQHHTSCCVCTSVMSLPNPENEREMMSTKRF